MTVLKRALLLILCLPILWSCQEPKPKYVIGVSQCSEDIWRAWQNSEMQMEANFHQGVELRFTAAHDNSDTQIHQIDSLVSSGIDLLIVAPNQLTNVSPAIDRAFDKGIPVIVFERKTDAQKYTAFVSADNYEMGHEMGEYVVSRLHGKGTVMEILGLKGSSPADDRHRGFNDALKGSEVQVVATIQGNWTEDVAYNAVKAYRGDLSSIDLVFGHNDRSAIGARKAFVERKSEKIPLFCGIDGLPGENGGIQLVRDSLLDASYIYPTRGDYLLYLALNILEGRPYQEETMLTSALVTRDNANVLLLESDEVMRQTQRLERLNQQASGYLQQLANERVINILAVILVILLLIMLVVIYIYFLQRARISEERNKMEREQLDFYTQVSHELRTPLTLIEGPLAQLAETNDIQNASAEASGLFSIVLRNTRHLSQLISKMLDAQVRHSSLVSIQESDPANLSQTRIPTLDTNDDIDSTHPTILIVDDNADIRAYLSNILKPHYQVNEAADGQQGLNLANEIVPDLIVSDVMMPVMNGLEFCQRVKNGTATSHIPVILLTARALDEHQVEGYESGADAYITKPFSAEVLLARINNLLKNRRRLKNLFGNKEEEKKEEKSKEVENNEEEAKFTTQESAFLLKFRDFIEKNLADSDLSVETVGAELGLSRVQLYRKVKALTGLSPVELLRTARLQKGRQILESTGKSVSEVAYEVGFTAPSYFTKCFKDEFGISPSDL